MHSDDDTSNYFAIIFTSFAFLYNNNIKRLLIE